MIQILNCMIWLDLLFGLACPDPLKLLNVYVMNPFLVFLPPQKIFASSNIDSQNAFSHLLYAIELIIVQLEL